MAASRTPGRAQRPRCAAGAGRVVRRVGGGGGGAAGAGRDGDGHRRVDPPAGGLLRHRGHQADLWAVLALRHRGLRLLARPGRALRAHGRGLRDPAAVHGGPRSEGLDQRRPAGAGLRRGLRAVGEGAADRRAEGIPPGRHAPGDRARCGSRASTGCAMPARRSSRSRCRTRNTRCRPTTSSRRPRRRRTSRAMTACASGCAWRRTSDLRDLYERTRAAGFGPRCAGAS
jgi:hypothetical protein